jgi:hypothetical protein
VPPRVPLILEPCRLKRPAPDVGGQYPDSVAARGGEG